MQPASIQPGRLRVGAQAMGNDAFSRVKIDVQLKEQGWDTLNSNARAVRVPAAGRNERGLRAVPPGLAVAADRKNVEILSYAT